ncbi:hypothetical protein [uncultured Psychrobacter sp.]|uniref:hypothetical protein n=1 Tax=uncultured Psychrobacter sp. TaxID=259303 RepID=UPI0030DDA8CE
MNNYKQFKGRKIDFSKPVKVYKNLNNGLFSVVQGGVVVAHVDTITLKAVSFKVSEVGRQRVIATKQKNVHAYVVGEVVTVNEKQPKNIGTHPPSRIMYNPYKFSYFYGEVTEYDLRKGRQANSVEKAKLEKFEVLHISKSGMIKTHIKTGQQGDKAA